MSDDRPCHMEGIGTVLVKMFDGMVREFGCEVYTSTDKEYYLC